MAAMERRVPLQRSTVVPELEMRSMLRESVENAEPLLVHAVADKTAELFLNAMESEAKRFGYSRRTITDRGSLTRAHPFGSDSCGSS